ncbi:hypothetical protein LEP3755_48240 [Leptolyngbya sp. NIES-3755]|nr:hypothetical protein LEP3755_48240 [Leptolyngbya sp. NIES-3755]
MVQCMTYPTDTHGVPGYRFVKPTRNGVWGVWVSENNSFDRDEWNRKKEAAQQAKQVQIANVMPLKKRDEYYRNLLAQGSLSERDKADLEKRGIKDLSIAISLGYGYVLPFKGLGGSYVGAQVRLTGENIEGGRYRWHDLPGGKQYPGTDEMPIAVFKVENPTAISLVEGTGVKPLIASERLKAITIGAAGGNFSSSPTQLKAVIEAFPGLPVVIVPDAGDVVNTQVANRIQRQVEYLRSIDVEPSILWWGQTTKNDNDIDELTREEFTGARSLSWDEFSALLPGNELKQRPDESERDRLLRLRKFRFAGYWKDLKRDFQLSQSIEGVDQIEYEGYCPTLDPYWDTIAVQGWLGTGKTETIIRSLKPFQDKAIVWVAPNNGLNRQTAMRAYRHGFQTFHYQDDVTMNRIALNSAAPGIYFMCPDSFKEYAVGEVDWSQVVLVMDEFSGIRKDIHTKVSELPQISKAIENCGSLITADAFLSDVDLELIQSLRGHQIGLYRQEAAKSRKSIKWIETRNAQGDTSFSHQGVYLDLLGQWADEIAAGTIQRIAIAVDSILTAKVIRNFLQSKGVRTWLACSETPEENSRFMPNPDETIIGSQAQAIVYTPTAKSGLDIQASFDRGLLISCGVLCPTEMLQMMGRCRQCGEWFVSAPRHTATAITPSLNGQKVKQWGEVIRSTFADLEYNAPYCLQVSGLWENLTSDITKAFGSEYLQSLCEEYFASVESIEVSSGSKTKWDSFVDSIKFQDAENILKASLESGYRLIDAQKQPHKNSQVWDVKLATLHGKYPALIERMVKDGSHTAIDFCKLLTSSRITKLKNWIIAEDCHLDDDENLLERLKNRVTTYNSGAFKARQNITLYRELKLIALVSLSERKPDNAISDQTAFNMRSPVICGMWQQFQANAALRKLFPLVETIDQFWKTICNCMKAFGFQSVSKKAREKTSEARPNGTFRGVQRYTNSRTSYFIGWIYMDCSGNNFFKQNYQIVVGAIRDNIIVERADRKAKKEGQSPVIERVSTIESMLDQAFPNREAGKDTGQIENSSRLPLAV